MDQLLKETLTRDAENDHLEEGASAAEEPPTEMVRKAEQAIEGNCLGHSVSSRRSICSARINDY